MPESSSQKLAIHCAQAADRKLALDIQILDLRKVSSFTDFFVICSADSEPQLRAIASEIESSIQEELGLKPYSRDGATQTQWLVLDYVDVVIHIFMDPVRQKYALEDFWSDAPVLDFSPTP